MNQKTCGYVLDFILCCIVGIMVGGAVAPVFGWIAGVIFWVAIATLEYAPTIQKKKG